VTSKTNNALVGSRSCRKHSLTSGKATILASRRSKGYNHNMAKKKPLSEQLRDADVTRYRISQATGIAQGQLSRFVHAQSRLSMDTLDILAEYLELEVISKQNTRKRR